MEIADIEREIARIKQAQFENQMNDHMSRDDYEYDRKCEAEIKELEARLERMKGGQTE